MKNRFYRRALLVAVALAGITAAVLSAQSQNQRLVIRQNGALIGTLEVPAAVTVRVGTVFSDRGQPLNQIVHLGQPRENPAVVINAGEGTTIVAEP